MVGKQLDSVVTLVEKRTLRKGFEVIDSTSFPLHTVIYNQRSLFSDRLLLLGRLTGKPSVPWANKLFNSTVRRRSWWRTEDTGHKS